MGGRKKEEDTQGVSLPGVCAYMHACVRVCVSPRVDTSALPDSFKDSWAAVLKGMVGWPLRPCPAHCCLQGRLHWEKYDLVGFSSHRAVQRATVPLTAVLIYTLIAPSQFPC